MLWQIIFCAAGVLCLGYYLLIAGTLHKWNSTFSSFWLAAGILLLLGSFVAERLGCIELFGVLLLAFFLAVFFTCLLIGSGMRRSKKGPCRYLIVLGAQVSGRRITDSLKLRLDRAKEYLIQNEETLVIVSGGRGKGEEISEAEAMASYLMENGIAKERIFQEDQSRTTRENLLFSAAFMEERGCLVGIVSNHFHLYRALQYAKAAGYSNVCPIAAGCNPVLCVNYMVRECFAIWKMWLTK